MPSPISRPARRAFHLISKPRAGPARIPPEEPHITSPLIRRLIDDLGWPHLDSQPSLAAFLGHPGLHVLFVPGDPVRNLESNDAAVILPELTKAFRGAFDCAVVADPIERAVRERFRVFATPSLIFVADGALRGAIPRVRDWDDYVTKVRTIIAGDIVVDAA